MNYCPHCMRPVTGDVCPACGKAVDRQNPGHLLQVGTVLSGSSGEKNYMLGVPLGQGGFGVTYIGVELETGRRVAVKEYFPSRCSCRGAGGRVDPLPGQETDYANGRFSFLKETHMLASLEGMPSVVQALDYLEANNTAYLVMEFLDGTPLYRIVNEKGKIPAEELLPRLQPLMRDIGLLHAKNVIHRDISPDNVMWLTDGTLKLMDFGCARSTEGSGSMTIALKQGFAPVEQYQSKGQGPYTDVYAFAATIYYCLTGIIPPAAVERQLGGSFLQSPVALGAALTPDQENALLWAMTVDPKSRPANMDVFARRLFPPAQTNAGNAGTAGQPNAIPVTAAVVTGPAGAVPSGAAANTGAIPRTSDSWGPGGNTGAAAGGVQQNTQPAPASGPKANKKLPLIAAAGAGAAAVVVAAVLVLPRFLGGGETVSQPTPPPALPTPPAVSKPVDTPPPEETAQLRISEEGFVYDLRDGYAAITGYTDTEELIVAVPSELEGLPVTVIEENAMQGADHIQYVFLPGSLKEIEAHAFQGCSNLRNVLVLSEVQADASSFDGCARLRCLLRSNSGRLNGAGSALPRQCITLEQGMETGAGPLKFVYVTNDGTIYAGTENEEAVLMDVPTDLDSLTVPEVIDGYPVVWIYADALSSADGLTAIDLPDDIAFDPSLLLPLLDVKDLGIEDGSFVESWVYTCALCDEINGGRSAGAPMLQPSEDLVRSSIIRSVELKEKFQVARPNDDKWSTVVPKGFSWDFGTEYIYRRENDENRVSSLTAVLEELAEKGGMDSDGNLYMDAGFGVYYDDQMYLTCILTRRE